MHMTVIYDNLWAYMQIQYAFDVSTCRSIIRW